MILLFGDSRIIGLSAGLPDGSLFVGYVIQPQQFSQ